MAISAIKDDTYYTEQGKTAVQAARDTALKDNTTLYTGQTDITNKTYDAQVDAAGKAYDQSYRENAVQKAINERQVAESMANLGLTNSGLNRTQQTAIQLSYANNKAGIDRQRQSALSELDIKRAQDLATIEQNKLVDQAKINQHYDGLAQQYATDLKTADVEAYKSYVSNVNKQAEENSKLYEYAYDKMNGDKVEYRVFHLDGKEVKVKDGYNPYNRENNKAKYAYEAKNYGFFSNGYQPKGVEGHGAFVGAVGEDNRYGKSQSVWEAEDGTLWYWNGRTNEYELYDLEIR